MTEPARPKPTVAIACGGTGGHLFPGLAVADELRKRGCRVHLLISAKEIDQQAIAAAGESQFSTLPAVGLTRGQALSFFLGFVGSYRRSMRFFREFRPHAVLAMGGFTSAPPILAGKRWGASAFLHDSNSIPGKANRWLSRISDGAFICFAQAGAHLRATRVTVIGTPVRPQFRQLDPLAARAALGLDTANPDLLVTGGSQGASSLNSLAMSCLPTLRQFVPGLQVLHLTGAADLQRTKAAYSAAGVNAVVTAFLDKIWLALASATVAVSRAGGSSLAELASTRVPAVLVPYPSATDNHQYFNALALQEAGAALLMEQHAATPERMSAALKTLLLDSERRSAMQTVLANWDRPRAAEHIALDILQRIGAISAVSSADARQMNCAIA